MFRKMMLALTAIVALAAWASAKPGTWGKEAPVNETESKAPAVKFNLWLSEFSKAYEQRDSEAMDELLKRFEAVKEDRPAAPRIEKWMDNVRQAYKEEDIQKMGRLLDNAQQLRERMRQHPGRNPNRRGRENANEFRPDRRPMRGFDERGLERMGSKPRHFNQRPFDAQGDFGRRGDFRQRGEMRQDRMAQRQGPRQSLDAQRPNPMRQEARRFGSGQQRQVGQMPQYRQRYGRPDSQRNLTPDEDSDRPGFGPRQERQERRFECPMRQQSDRSCSNEQHPRRHQYRRPDADAPRDFRD